MSRDQELADAVAEHLGPDVLRYLLTTVPDPEAWRAEATRYLRRIADRVNTIAAVDVRFPHVTKLSQAIRAQLTAWETQQGTTTNEG